MKNSEIGSVTVANLPGPNLDIKTVSLEILRDLYSASRKLMMYPLGHPITNDILKKPYDRLCEIFRFKHSFVLQVYNQRLVAEGLLLDDNVFVSGLVMDLTRHNIRTIILTTDLAVTDLYHFLDKLLETKSPGENFIQKYLDLRKISSIKINPTVVHTLYHFENTVIGGGTAFVLADRINEIILEHPDLQIGYYLGKLDSDEEVVRKLGVDLRFDFLKRYFGQATSTMPENKALEIFKQAIFSTDWLGEAGQQEVLQGLRQLWRDYASRSEDIAILLPVYKIFKSVGATDDVLEYVFDRAALLKLNAVRDAERIGELLKSSMAREIDFQQMRKTVFKLATDKYSRPLEELLAQLLACHSSRDLDTRQRSLRLTIGALQTLADGSFWDVYGELVKEILRIALSPNLGPEIIELMGWVGEKSAEEARWEEFKICCQALKSIAAEKAEFKRELAGGRLAELGGSAVINDILVDAVIKGKGGSDLFEAIAALPSAKIAAGLVDRVDSPDKAIRARIIKALVGMGQKAGPEVIRRIAEIVGAGETDDDGTWYRLRNYLRIMGQIRYLEALPYLEILAGWRQARIKQEIISACEAVESPATGVILSRLALDRDYDIRKAAVIALGVSGHPDMIKYLRALFDDSQSDRVLLVAAIGRIGGNQARDVLIDLYENSNIYRDLEISKKDEQNIKIAILKGLSKIGDDVSRSKIELYSRKSYGKGGFFKKDVLSQTATILLDEFNK